MADAITIARKRRDTIKRPTQKIATRASIPSTTTVASATRAAKRRRAIVGGPTPFVVIDRQSTTRGLVRQRNRNRDRGWASDAHARDSTGHRSESETTSSRSTASRAFLVFARVLRPNTPLTIQRRASAASGSPSWETSGVRRGLR